MFQIIKIFVVANDEKQRVNTRKITRQKLILN